VNPLKKKIKYLLFVLCLLSAGFTSFSQTLSSKEFRPQVGFGAGYFSFYGEVNNNKANSPFVGQMGFSFDVSRKINSYFDLGFTYMNATMTGNQNTEANLNFQTRVNSFSAYGLYNWGHLFHNNVIQPYTSIGFETFEFNSKADLVNAAGNPYFHWDDGSIKNIAQTAPNAADAIELKRDYDYESDLRGLNLDGLGNYARVSFSVPVGVGVQFNISDRFTLRMGSCFHYTFTDNVDNVSDAGTGLRAGNASNDYFFYNSASLHYDLLGGAARAKKDFQFVDYFTINTTDTDNDGVFDWYDRCLSTPKGVAVDSSGCPLDSDHDGVPDYLDKEESAAKAFVNANGVEMTAADYEKWYRRYIDSLDIPYEILVKLADANRSGNSIYRVLVGEYSKKIPDNLADKFLAQPDIIAATMNDTITGYFVGKFADIELAKARRKQLLDDKFPMAKIVMQRGNTFVLVEDFDKAAELEKQEQEKGKLKDKEGHYAIQLGSTPASANAEDKAKFIMADKDVKAISGEKNSTQFIAGKYKDLTSASVDLPAFKKEFKDAKVVKIQEGKVIDDKDSAFFKAPVIKQPTDLELMEGKYAVKISKITPITTAGEQQKIDKLLPQNLQVDNADGTKDVLSANTGFESVESAQKEATLLKQNGFKTEIVKVQDGKLVKAPATKEPVIVNSPKDSVKNKDLIDKFTVKVGEFDKGVSNKDMDKILNIPDVKGTETSEPNKTTYTAGNYVSLDSAKARAKKMSNQGFSTEVVKYDGTQFKQIPNTKVAAKQEVVKDGKVVYRVQLGAFKNKVSEKSFKGVQVVRFDGQDSLVRYAAGSLDNYKQAQELKISMRNEAFTDAFVTAYKDGVRISVADLVGADEFKNVPVDTTQKQISSKQNTEVKVVEEKKVDEAPKQTSTSKDSVNLAFLKIHVQVGLFAAEPPAEVQKILSTIPDLKIETTEQGLKRYITGEFKNPAEASAYKESLKAKGLQDSFLIAFYRGVKINMTTAIQYYEKMK